LRWDRLLKYNTSTIWNGSEAAEGKRRNRGWYIGKVSQLQPQGHKKGSGTSSTRFLAEEWQAHAAALGCNMTPMSKRNGRVCD
jgi:hypothetical protein